MSYFVSTGGITKASRRLLRLGILASLLPATTATAADPSARIEPRSAALAGVESLSPPNLATLHREGDQYVASVEGGGTAELTLDPRMQESAEGVLREFHVPYGAAVVISVHDGRVLALAGHSSVAPELGPEELALHPWAPAASVFKIVSASALVAEGGLTADSRVCYHGGVSSILPDNLVDMPRIDKACATLGYGIGKSQNAIIAKMASRHLTPTSLARMGRRFGFGDAIPFDVPVEPSTLDVPADNPLEFARTAAGFWHSTLSPFHGALLAATIANRGEMPAPRLVAKTIDARGRVLVRPRLSSRTVMPPAAAAQVGKMMEMTTRMGTAKGSFHDRKGRPLVSVSVAGKTGTLSATTDKGYVGYSWFVGYAPADKPEIAFAVVLGNPAVWRIRAAYVGRRLVADYVAGQRAQPPSRLVASSH